MRRAFWICAIAVLFFMGARAAYKSLTRPTPIALPATRSALGATITLKSAEQTSEGDIKLHLIADSRGGDPIPVEFADATINGLRGYQSIDSTHWGANQAGRVKQVKVEIESVHRVPHTRVATIRQNVQLMTPRRHASFRFENVSTGSKAITKKVGTATVTLSQMYIDKVKTSSNFYAVYCHNEGMDETKKSICFLIDAEYPAGYIQNHEVSMVDNRGHAYNSFSMIIDSSQTAKIKPAWPIMPEPGLVDRIVGSIDSTKAYNMRLNRVEPPQQPKQSVHFTALYAFKMIDPSAKSFTLELIGLLPPNKDETATVEFANVPIR